MQPFIARGELLAGDLNRVDLRGAQFALELNLRKFFGHGKTPGGSCPAAGIRPARQGSLETPPDQVVKLAEPAQHGRHQQPRERPVAPFQRRQPRVIDQGIVQRAPAPQHRVQKLKRDRARGGITNHGRGLPHRPVKSRRRGVSGGGARPMARPTHPRPAPFRHHRAPTR